MKSTSRYDSRYNSKLKIEIQDTIEYILDCNYGDLISFETLATKLGGYNLDDLTERNRFKSIMSRIRNFLIDYGYILKTIANVGYYILKPKQISGYCYHTYVRKTQNLLEKSDRILTHIDKSELSDIRLKEQKEMLKLNKSVYNNIDMTIYASDYEKNRYTYEELND